MARDPRDDGWNPQYSQEQAAALLAFIHVKLPGFLDAAEETLRGNHLWPECQHIAQAFGHQRCLTCDATLEPPREVIGEAIVGFEDGKRLRGGSDGP